MPKRHASHWFILLLLWLCMSHTACHQGSLAQESRGMSFNEMKINHHISGQILISFKEKIDETKLLHWIKQRGDILLAKIPEQRLYHIQLKANSSMEKSIIEYQQQPDIIGVERNYIRKRR